MPASVAVLPPEVAVTSGDDVAGWGSVPAGPGGEVSPSGPGRVHGSAAFSADGAYRYLLARRWSPGPVMTWVMLNPSTADGAADDPTVRRCVGFARAAGCGALTVVNLYAWRARDPRELEAVADPVGPDNDAWIAQAAGWDDSGPVVAAWGARSDPRRVRQVLALLAGRRVLCLGATGSGQPRHPLYVSAGTRLRPMDRLRAGGACPDGRHSWDDWQPVGPCNLPEALLERECLVCGLDQVSAAGCLGPDEAVAGGWSR